MSYSFQHQAESSSTNIKRSQIFERLWHHQRAEERARYSRMDRQLRVETGLLPRSAETSFYAEETASLSRFGARTVRRASVSSSHSMVELVDETRFFEKWH